MTMTNEEYVSNKGNRCPYCGSEEVEAPSSVEVDGGWAHQNVVCLSCDEGWVDHYKLVGYEGTEE